VAPPHGAVAQIDLKASLDRARSRGLLARVQIQIKIVLVVERGLEARGYVFDFCIGVWATAPHGRG
jgi:hypothetical protein